jgi:hypothetical protein
MAHQFDAICICWLRVVLVIYSVIFLLVVSTGTHTVVHNQEIKATESCVLS